MAARSWGSRWSASALVFPTLLVGLAACGCAVAGCSGGGAAAPGPRAAAAEGPPLRAPRAPERPVTETVHGVRITDPYRYLEDGKDPDTERYLREQAAHARAVLDALPGREALKRRVHELAADSVSVSVPQRGGGGDVFLRLDGGAEVQRLYRRDVTTGAERLLLDPDTLRGEAHHATVDAFALSPDARHVALAIAREGSEDGILRILEVATGRLLPDESRGVVPLSLTWLDDQHVGYRARSAAWAPGKTEELWINMRFRSHPLGASGESDEVLLGPGVNPTLPGGVIRRLSIKAAPSSPLLLGVAYEGTRDDYALYTTPRSGFRAAAARWTPLTTLDDRVRAYVLRGTDLYVLTRGGAPRGKVVRVDLTRPSFAGAEVVVPESDVILEDLVGARDGLYVTGRFVTEGRLLRVPYGGGKPATVAVPPQATLLVGGSPEENGVRALVDSWTAPARVFALAAGSAPQVLPIAAGRAPVPLEAELRWVTAKDGTRIPLSLVRAAGAPRDGKRPTLLETYASYGISRLPRYTPLLPALAERGGVYAFCHARGGGELGDAWRDAAFQATKSVTWRDTLACAEAMIASGYTSPDYLVAGGASAGGIAAGNAVNERPDLFAAALFQVGLHNTVRLEQGPAGRSNSQEFGSASTAEGFRSLLAMDSYLGVKDGVAYPAVLIATGRTDPRVPVWQPAKMAARLQAATRSAAPVLLRIEEHAGHGVGSAQSQREEMMADALAFVFAHVGRGTRSGPR